MDYEKLEKKYDLALEVIMALEEENRMLREENRALAEYRWMYEGLEK